MRHLTFGLCLIAGNKLSRGRLNHADRRTMKQMVRNSFITVKWEQFSFVIFHRSLPLACMALCAFYLAGVLNYFPFGCSENLHFFIITHPV